MNKLWIAILIVIGLILPGCQTQKNTSADIILKNGNIQTMTSESDVQEALAIKNDKIIFVGKNKKIGLYVGKNTKIIDLKGKMVLPGFGDGHIHMPGRWSSRLFSINLEKEKTHSQYLKKIRYYIKNNPYQKVYKGTSLNLNLYKRDDGSNPGPTKDDLDRICSEKPIIISDVSNHSIWVNSKALSIAKITKNTPDPHGGVIRRTSEGEPSGLLTDAAQDLIYNCINTNLTDEQTYKALEAFQKEASSLGITQMTNMWSLEDSKLSPYLQLEKDKKLHLRVRQAYMVSPKDKPLEVIHQIKKINHSGSKLISGGTAKLFYDGVTEGGTAYMIGPYSKEVGFGENWHGESLWEKNKFEEMVSALDKVGIQVHTHAIGDKAVKETLNAYEYSEKNNGKRDARHTITHVSSIQDNDILRFKQMNVIAALQFLWMYKDSLYELEKLSVGEQRANNMYPVKKMYQAGVSISGASDTPVTDYNPFKEIEVGVTRNTPFKEDINQNCYRNKKESVTPYQMLEFYTKNVAHENFLEKNTGTLEVGKKADLIVVSQNILKVKSSEIGKTKVLYTFFDGKIVYKK
ncbi:TPA: amidohydrolase [Enterococcus faecalis]|nr:amidohydrolase [Enterococcus faecalis]